MDLLSSAPKQGAVGRVLDQGVLEGILRIGRSPMPEDQLRRNKLGQGVIELSLGDFGNRTDQFM